MYATDSMCMYDLPSTRQFVATNEERKKSHSISLSLALFVIYLLTPVAIQFNSMPRQWNLMCELILWYRSNVLNCWSKGVDDILRHAHMHTHIKKQLTSTRGGWVSEPEIEWWVNDRDKGMAYRWHFRHGTLFDRLPLHLCVRAMFECTCVPMFV